MNRKWNIHRKGYLKIYVAVDIKTKKILLSMRITDEYTYDSKVIPKLVDETARTNEYTIDNLLADESYDGNGIFKCLSKNGIIVSCIKVRKNTKVREIGQTIINLSTITRYNLQQWKDSMVSYGQRWMMVEIVLSSSVL